MRFSLARMFVITFAAAIVFILCRLPLQVLASGKSLSAFWISLPLSWLNYGLFGDVKILNWFDYDSSARQISSEVVGGSLMVGFLIYTVLAIMAWEFVRYLFKITRLKSDNGSSNLPSSDG